MQLSLTLFHPAKLPILAYGGTERVVWWLAKELSRLGHQVNLLCGEDSTCDFAKVKVFDPSRPLVEQIPKDSQILHSFVPFSEELNTPTIVTIEGNGKPGERFQKNTVFVSKDHAQRHGSSTFVYNGLDPDDYPGALPKPEERKRGLVFLAKAKWKVKNVRGAIQVSKYAECPLDILGGKGFSFSRKIRWHGMVGGERKLNVLRQAKALIFPVRWHEPFGIALTESLFLGLPVLGTPYGSLPEIISEEVGFLSSRSKDLADCYARIDSFSPVDCRKRVLEKFSVAGMTQKYLEMYETILSGKTLNSDEPRTQSSVSANTLLPWES